jgi:hypothetical protein
MRKKKRRVRHSELSIGGSRSLSGARKLNGKRVPRALWAGLFNDRSRKASFVLSWRQQQLHNTLVQYRVAGYTKWEEYGADR